MLQYPGSLPMLSVLLSMLYEKSIENNRNRLLLQEDYDKNIGGVSGALHTKLNALLGEDNKNETILKLILLRMIHIEGGIYTKKKVNKMDLVFEKDDLNRQIIDELNILINERIIHTVDGEEECWEPVHDAAVRWDKIKIWIEEIGTVRIGLQKELENDIEIYERNGSKKNDLWHNNDRLKTLVSELSEEIREENNLKWMLNKRERSFIELSEKIRSRRKKRTVFIVSFAMIILTVTTIVAIFNAREANKQRQTAENNLKNYMITKFQQNIQEGDVFYDGGEYPSAKVRYDRADSILQQYIDDSFLKSEAKRNDLENKRRKCDSILASMKVTKAFH